MNKFIKGLMIAVALSISGAAFAAAELGRDYNLLKPPQPTDSKKIEVLEFFFYGCSHCFHLHKPLTAWEKSKPKDVDLVFVPTIFRDSMEPMARTMYALESMGQLDKLHDALYRAWNEDNIELFDEASIADFVARNGVDRAKFSAAYNSFSMQSRVARARQMVRSYRINGTPTLVVAGKYVITGLQPEDTVRVLKEVIDIARKARSGRK
ncbi:MAG: thiol:disulfide interchange protein DsbA/DsbL [Pseudomonadota bacterium]